jgi:hypothetical protein
MLQIFEIQSHIQMSFGARDWRDALCKYANTNATTAIKLVARSLPLSSSFLLPPSHYIVHSDSSLNFTSYYLLKLSMHSFSLILSLILPALFVLAVPLDSREDSNAYTGTGGQAPGGSVNDAGGLINLFSSKYHYMRLVPNQTLTSVWRQRRRWRDCQLRKREGRKSERA